MGASAGGRLFPTDSRKSKTCLDVLAFPHAGGGPSMFRRWRQIAPATLAIRPVMLPGREERLAEPGLSDAVSLVDALVSEVAESGDQPYALLGHSLGAILAYAVTMEIEARGLRRPLFLCVAASAPPPLHLMAAEGEWSREALLNYVRKLGGMPAELLDDPEFVELQLAQFGTDLALSQSLDRLQWVPVRTPIIAFAGESDPGASPTMMEEWRHYTTSFFDAYRIEGGHFFPYDLAVAGSLLRTLDRYLP